MKKKETFYLLLLCLAMVFSGCRDKDDDDNGRGNGKREPSGDVTLDWIYEEMNEKYLWNDKLPSNPKDSDPEKFFYSLLYKYTDEGNMLRDRFSYISPYDGYSTKSSASAPETDLGFEYIPIYFKENSDAVGFLVIYIKSNTWAQQNGLKRGDYIYKIDNVVITDQNYNSILDGKSRFVATLINSVGGESNVSIDLMQNYEENPIYISKVITVDGLKIGYLMYNQFEKGDNNRHDVELMRAIDDLKNKGITEFVLDLRYNPGGYISSATNLAGALVPNRSKSNIFAKYKYNPTYHASQVSRYGKNAVENDYFTDVVSGTKQAVPKLDLKRVYILATQYSASASELVINGLRPYMDVIHVGTATTGKDKGSFAITPPKNKDIKWELHPLIMRVTNSKGEGDYINGLKPNINFKELAAPLSDNLGDPAEPLLAKAISHMTGKKSISEPDETISKMTIRPISGVALSQKKDPYRMYADESRFEE